METWIVPGAPLERGKGWRIWFCKDARGPTPAVSRVELVSDGTAQEYKETPHSLPLANLSREFGIIELTLTNPQPGANYRVHIPQLESLESHPVRPGWLEMRSLPSKLPPEGVSFLFASCFWRDDDQYGGGYAGVVQNLVKKEKPIFKMLIGDQVYQDWPSAWPGNGGALELYNTRYEAYWGARGYQDVLLSTPNFFLCDDHEFWNDYPERQFHLERTYTEESRKVYGKVAADLYSAYQGSANPGDTAWYSFKIDPVSFFVADTRSERTYINQQDGPHFFSGNQWAALKEWFVGLKGPGVLVLGQPLFQDDGDFKDHSLSNFEEDYDELRKLIVASHSGENDDRTPHQILVLTGDIHCGRLSRGHVAGAPSLAAEMWEFVASPISRISPYMKTPKPEMPRGSVAGPAGDHRPIAVELIEDAPSALGPGTRPTIHNNVGMVRMTPIADGTVRFELSLRCIRPYNHVHLWELDVDKASFPPPYSEVLRKEIVLR